MFQAVTKASYEVRASRARNEYVAKAIDGKEVDNVRKSSLRKVSPICRIAPRTTAVAIEEHNLIGRGQPLC
jgi:alpha-D-ribose 1-methylphosphonate 5-triphosphate synthase subunit PhnL